MSPGRGGAFSPNSTEFRNLNASRHRTNKLIMGGGEAHHSPDKRLHRRFPPGSPQGRAAGCEAQKEAQPGWYGGQDAHDLRAHETPCRPRDQQTVKARRHAPRLKRTVTDSFPIARIQYSWGQFLCDLYVSYYSQSHPRGWGGGGGVISFF